MRQENEYGRHRTSAQKVEGSSPASPSGTNSGTSPQSAGENPNEVAAIRAGEIIGYRAWIIDHESGFLRSMYAPHEWKPRRIETAYLWHRYTEYEFKCDWESVGIGGLHSFKTMTQAVVHYECYAVSNIVVFGSIFMWGSVVEHEIGWRSEFASVRSIDRIKRGLFFWPCSPRNRREIWRLRHLYCNPSTE